MPAISKHYFFLSRSFKYFHAVWCNIVFELCRFFFFFNQTDFLLLRYIGFIVQKCYIKRHTWIHRLTHCFLIYKCSWHQHPVWTDYGDEEYLRVPELFQNCSWIVPEYLWNSSGTVPEYLWNSSGTVPELFRNTYAREQFRNCSNIIWNSSGTVPELFKNSSRTVLKLFWNCSRTVPRYFWNSFGTIKEQFRNCSLIVPTLNSATVLSERFCWMVG